MTKYSRNNSTTSAQILNLPKRLSSVVMLYSRATSKNFVRSSISSIKCLEENVFITSCRIALAKGMFHEQPLVPSCKERCCGCFLSLSSLKPCTGVGVQKHLLYSLSMSSTLCLVSCV